MDPGIGPLFYSYPWVLRMQCKNVQKTTFIIFYTVLNKRAHKCGPIEEPHLCTFLHSSPLGNYETLCAQRVYKESLSPFLVQDFGAQSFKIVQRVYKAWESPLRRDKELRGIHNGIIGGYHEWLKVRTRGLDWLSKLKIINE